MNRMSNYAWAISLALTVLGWVWVFAGERSSARDKLSDLDQRILAIQARHDLVAQRLADVQTSVVQIRTDVEWIRHELRKDASASR
jgi:hypothetical protein